MAINKVIMTGRLTATPELKMTPSGVSVVSFSIAQNRKDAVDYFDFVAWRQTAEFICKYFTKGDGIEIVGHLTTRTKEYKGVKYKECVIECDGVAFPVGRAKSDDTPTDTAPQFSAPQTPQFEEVGTDDDLPF